MTPRFEELDWSTTPIGDEFLMSSLFTVVVVGLGLGYTAQAALADRRVHDLVVVDALEPVIRWHERGLVPVGPVLAGDDRCRVVHGDFFAMTEEGGFDADVPNRMFDAVLVDIDHSPRHLLADGSAGFYDVTGSRRLAERIRAGGVFALWSNDPPDEDYVDVLQQVFVDVVAEVVTIANRLQDRPATNTVYLATAPA